MANLEHENINGVVDKRFDNRSSTNQAGTIGTSATYDGVSTLRARLQAINAAYYTNARLENMTKNDMVYAVRLNDDAGGI